MKRKLNSIRSTDSLDQSGRDAKRGFAYQDHVGVRLCLEMLSKPEIIEIWVEKEDDLTIISKIDNKEHLEFCQVKHTQEKQSRWSLANICQSDSTKSGIGKNFIEKSLEQDRCSEDAVFRVISSYPVSSELKYLTYERNSISRENQQENLNNLATSIKNRISDKKSPKGTNIEMWVKNCWWQKLPDTTTDLRNSNILFLEEILNSAAIELLPNHRDELYQLILQKVYEASSCDLKENQDGFKIEFKSFFSWIKEKAEALHLAIINDKLEMKLLKAGADNSIVQSARQLKYKFKKEKLNSNYVKPNNLAAYEESILEKLHDLKIELYSEEIKMNGMEFLSLCNKEIQKISVLKGNDKNGLSSSLGKGIMYDLTSKCIHQFTKDIS